MYIPSLNSELEVDHIDTNILNYDLSNLQVLSKKDHLVKSLEDRGQNKRELRRCATCDRTLAAANTTDSCRFCKSALKAKEELHKRIGSWDKAGALLGISGNALRKRYKDWEEIPN